MKIGSFKTMLAAGLVLAFGAVATPAGAQRSDDMRPGQGGGGHPCAGDAQRLCSSAIPDRAKVASCLFKAKGQVSAACRAELGGGQKAGKSRKGKRHAKRHRRR